MIEIFYIITEILFIITILSLPVFFIDKNYYFKSLKFTFIDKLAINLIIFINILLLVSILNIKLNYILYSYFLLMIILSLINFKKNNFDKVKINYFLLIIILFIFLISIDIADQIYLGWDAKRNWIF